ncbi:unnamed protein product, partial [Staurois parvus]
PAVPPTSSAHLCPAVRPLALPTCAQQCHTPVPTHLCPPTSAAQQCCQSVPPSVPSSDASQCRLSVPIISVTYQCCILVPPIHATSVLHISAAYQCPS